uniref:Uncharacterized protein n=1 Tax=Salix viminalis TaxID=40686 RepID=A0A6N2MJG4_SALVM
MFHSHRRISQHSYFTHNAELTSHLLSSTYKYNQFYVTMIPLSHYKINAFTPNLFPIKMVWQRNSVELLTEYLAFLSTFTQKILIHVFNVIFYKQSQPLKWAANASSNFSLYHLHLPAAKMEIQ